MIALKPHSPFMVQGRHRVDSNETTVEMLWSSYYQQLRGFVRPKVVSDEACEDLLQTAFFRAHEALTAGAEPRQPRAWLYQIARNLLVDVYRSEDKRGVLTSALRSEGAPRVDESELLTSEREAADLIARALPDFVRALPSPYREALELTDLQGLSQTHAAAQLGVSATCMKTRVRRGRQQLLEALMKCCTFEVDGRGRPISCARRTSSSACGCGCG